MGAHRAKVCADLRQQGPYQRYLTLVAAMVARDCDGITAATHDPQPSIRTAALTGAPLAGRLRDDSRALAALLDAVAPARRGEMYDRAMAEVDTTR